MSAIVALYSFAGYELPVGSVDKMLSSLAHRGAYSAVICKDDRVQLGCRLQSTAEDTPNDILPFQDPDRGCVIACDARIDNRSELIAQLSLEIDPELPWPDSRLILAAYNKWGENCTKYFIGDFVFVIWDPASQVMFCARDPLGIRHFYYYHSWRFLLARDQA